MGSRSCRLYVPDQFGIRRALIDIEDAVARLDRLYRDRDLLAAKSAEARRFAEASTGAGSCPSGATSSRPACPKPGSG